MSERIDVDPRYISCIELGHCFPALEILENIARALNAEMKELFDYQHQIEETDYQDEITKILDSAENEKQRLMILRITKAVTRTVLNNF